MTPAAGGAVNTFIESTQKNLFFVRENGLFVLRKGSETLAKDYYEFYKDETSKYELKFLIIMIVGIIFLSLS